MAPPSEATKKQLQICSARYRLPIDFGSLYPFWGMCKLLLFFLNFLHTVRTITSFISLDMIKKAHPILIPFAIIGASFATTRTLTLTMCYI